MVRNYLIFLICFTSTFSWSQKKLLPIADNGKWGLVDETGTYILMAKYDYLEYNYRGKKFIYHVKNRVGVIDNDGSIATEAVYDQISFLDTNWFCFRKKESWTLMFEDEIILEESYDSITKMSEDIFQLTKGDSSKFFNNKTRKTSKDWYLEGGEADKFVIGTKPKGIDFLNLKELDIFYENALSYEHKTSNYRVIVSEKKAQLLDTNNNRFVFEEYDLIKFSNGNFFIGIREGIYYFLDTETDKTYQIPETQEIAAVNFPFLVFEKDRFVGLYNLQNSTEVLPATFDGINFSSNLLYVKKGGLFGLYNTSGKQIIPATYDDITDYDRFYQIEENSKLGLMSKNGNILEKCEYDEIRIYDSNIKCLSQDKLVMINMDGDGKIKDRKIYEEFMSLSFEKQVLPKQRSKNMQFSGPATSKDGMDEEKEDIYNKYGWYRLTREVQKRDTVIKVKGNWSLHSFEDSILINRRYKSLWLVDDYKYTFAFRSKMLDVGDPDDKNAAFKQKALYSFHNNLGFSRGFFEWIDNRTRTKVNKELYQHIFLTDFHEYGYARAITQKPILIDSLGNVLHGDITYMGTQQEDFLLISQNGSIEKTKKSSLVDFGAYSYLNNLGLRGVSVQDEWPYFRIKNGQWSFIKKDGSKLNKEPFQFATDFVKGQAIVQRGGKWGVIDTAMNEIVPIEYNSVKRIYVDGQIYFEVKNNVQRNYVYERSTGIFQDTEIDEMSNYTEGVWFAHQKSTKTWALVDTNLNNLTPFQFQHVGGYKDEYAQVTRRGKKQIITTTGTTFFEGFKTRSITPLGYDRFEVYIKKNKRLIININGDTLVGANECKEVIYSNKDYVVYYNLSNRINIYSETKEIKLPKKSEILSLNLENELVFLKKGSKNRVFSLKTAKYVSKHIENAIHINADSYSFKNSMQKIGIVSFSGDTLVPAIYEKISFKEEGWMIAQFDKNEIYLLNSKGAKMYEEAFFRLREENGHYLIYGKNGAGLLQENGNLLIPCEYISIEKYNSIYYKVRTKRGFYLLDLEGNKIVNRAFEDIKGMSSKGLIVTQGREDFLYSGYINSSLSFQSITPISSDKFILGEKAKYGIYSTKGELIIPVEYHFVKIDRGLFKVRFFNSFGYFTQDGESIFNPKN